MWFNKAMTHDELLENLNTWVRFLADKNKGKEWVKALLAVVELHKPVEVSHNYYDTGLGCSAPSCHDKYDEPSYYPCETIQAIQGQLSTEIVPADEA